MTLPMVQLATTRIGGGVWGDSLWIGFQVPQWSPGITSTLLVITHILMYSDLILIYRNANLEMSGD
jgi:hypothetical protein